MTEQSIVEKSSVYISANHEYFKYMENALCEDVALVVYQRTQHYQHTCVEPGELL